MSSTDAKALLEQAVRNFQDEVPALQQLKMVVAVELQGRGDTQTYRVEVPGPKVTKEIPTDARVRIAMPRAFFNVMATEGKVADWREAFTYGKAKASGPEQMLKLIVSVVERHEQRARLRRQTRH